MLGHPAFRNLRHSLEHSLLRGAPYEPFSPDEPFSWTRGLLDTLPCTDYTAFLELGWSYNDRFIIEDYESFKAFVSRLAKALENAEFNKTRIGVSRKEDGVYGYTIMLWTKDE